MAPSLRGNSVAVMNLLRLARMTQSPLLSPTRPSEPWPLSPSRLQLAPVSHSADARGLRVPARRTARDHSWPARPDSAEMRALLRQLHTRFVPGKVVLMVDSAKRGKRSPPASPPSSLWTRWKGVRAPTFARNYTCRLPVTEPAEFAELIQY